MNKLLRIEDVLSDDTLLTEECLIEIKEPTPPCWEKFQYELYDWDDPEFLKANRGRYAYRPVLLGHGYFMMVLVRSYKRMTIYPDGRAKKWYRSVKSDSEGNINGMYAYRKGRKVYGEPSWVYAHRELLGILHEPLLVGDHINGWGLDNRGDERGSVNLARVLRGVNGHNAIRFRPDGLPAGVERKSSRRGVRYGGKICFRVNKKKVITIRSRRNWRTPERAAAWYQNYLKREHRRATWAHNPQSVNYPLFPPHIDSEPAPVSKKAARRARTTQREEHIPF